MSDKSPKVHFIANGGSVMHNLALNLYQRGFDVTISDNSLTNTSQNKGLSINKGWEKSHITPDIDAVILDQQLEQDNPELQKAKELGLKVYSYPEYVFQQSLNKQRIVITGTHGKTTTTAMIMHVLKYFNKDFDFIIGSIPEGFETNVKITDSAPIIIIEGSERPSSPIDTTPEFNHYNHHIGLISGVEWSDAEIYTTLEDYVKQFEKFADATPKAGILVFSENDDVATLIGRKEREDVQRLEYKTADFEIQNNKTLLVTSKNKIPLNIFGMLNIKNLSGARALCTKIGITEDMFNEAISNFKGVKNRLEILEENASTVIIKDSAHTPSTLKASTTAVCKQYPNLKQVAVYELDPVGCSNQDFFKLYKDGFKGTELPIIYFDPQKSKKGNISPEEMQKVFNHPNLKVITDINELESSLKTIDSKNKSFLFMTTSDMGGIDFNKLAKTIINK